MEGERKEKWWWRVPRLQFGCRLLTSRERENYSRINIKGWRWKRSFHITNELRKWKWKKKRKRIAATAAQLTRLGLMNGPSVSSSICRVQQPTIESLTLLSFWTSAVAASLPRLWRLRSVNKKSPSDGLICLYKEATQVQSVVEQIIAKTTWDSPSSLRFVVVSDMRADEHTMTRDSLFRRFWEPSTRK